jgi:mono/diheme cytochrome c family protein
VGLAVVWGLSAAAQDLTIRMPSAMLESGFDKQILPRFGFKHRIRVAPVAEGDADIVLSDEPGGFRIMADTDDRVWFLSILTDEAEAKEKAATFLDWLQSVPGKAAIESFAPEGTSLYSTEVKVVVIREEESFDGDKALGARLALVHCGRCHVVDERNRMGGIGSTPSFAALRGRENWSDLFRAFFVHNPHPSFTQVEGVTEPFDPNRQIHVAPVEITLEEIEAIAAFVDTIEPKDLGRPVRSQ